MSERIEEPTGIMPVRRRGRPRADQTGEVEARVLDIATRLFLQQGFDRTTYEGIAELAHAGKATLYARYPTKDALFKEVVRRRVALSLARISAGGAGGAVRDRILRACIMLADETFVPDVIALMRITIVETERFPDMARASYDIGFGGCVGCIAEAIAGGVHAPDRISAAIPIATRIVEMALLPLQIHALYGVDLAALRERARRDVASVVDMVADGLIPFGETGPDEMSDRGWPGER